MTSFFIDLWHDLRERRLWPVAVGLLAAIVAVPAILFKPVDDSTPPAVAVTKPSGVHTLPVVSVDSGPITGSKLEAFSSSEKNPFKPMKDLAAAPGTSGDTGAGASSAGDSGSGATGASSSAGGSGSVAGGDSGSTGGGSVSGGSPSGGTSTPSSTTPHTTHTIEWFRYAADFSFGKSGEKAKVFESVANFTLLPNESTPAVVFLGVDAASKTAMFYIADSAFTADGEGNCNADGADCRYVTLKVGESSDEETFSAVDGGVSYDLKLLKIDRESLGSGSDPVAPEEPSKGKTLAATGAGVSAATSTTQDVLPTAFAAGPGVAVEEK